MLSQVLGDLKFASPLFVNVQMKPLHRNRSAVLICPLKHGAKTTRFTERSRFIERVFVGGRIKTSQ